MCRMGGHSYSYVKECILCRLCVITAIIVSDLIIYDHNAQGVQMYELESDNSDVEILMLRPFTRWDSAHYLKVSDHWYGEDETSYAFYPLYPLLIRTIAYLCGYETQKARILSGLLISNVCYICALPALRRILEFVEVPRDIIETALVVYLINPASVFFASVYTESLYACLTWWGMFLLQQGDSDFVAGMLLVLASSTRSNGILNGIFVAAVVIHRLLKSCSFIPTLQCIIVGIAVCVPFILFSFFTYASLCLQLWDINKNIESTQCDSPLGSVLSACSYVQRGPLWIGTFLGIYSAIQRTHWGVGFLRQYTLRQVPNIILGTPALATATYETCVQLSSGGKKCSVDCNTPALQPGEPQGNWYKDQSSPDRFKEVTLRSIPYILHMVALVLVCGLLAHVQVSTRVLLSGCPFMYLAIARLVRHTSLYYSRMAIILVLFYFTMGIALHPNYYPWT